MGEQDQQTRVFYELGSMIINILRSPSLAIPFPNPMGAGASASVSSSRTPQVSPTAFATLFLGISLALMLFGSVTFVIGFILMPWVIALVLLFYFVGIVSNLSELGRTILYPATARKDLPAWKFS